MNWREVYEPDPTLQRDDEIDEEEMYMEEDREAEYDEDSRGLDRD